jgi:hypothetical protein
LPWLSWTLSVEAWHEAKSDDARRALILNSIEIHRRKGTPWAIRLLIRSLGFGEVDIIERVGGRTHNGTIRRDGVYPHAPLATTWATYMVVLPAARSRTRRPSACASSCRPSLPRAAIWWRCAMRRSRTATTAPRDATASSTTEAPDMANLNETDQWVEGVYQLEEDDPVLGGPTGIDNRAPRELANRSRYQRLRNVTPWDATSQPIRPMSPTSVMAEPHGRAWARA